MAPLALILTLAITLTLLALIVWYLPTRLATLSGAKRRWPFFAGIAAVVGSFMALTGVVAGSTSTLVGMGAIVASVAAVFVLYLALGTLLMDLVRRFVDLPDRTALMATVAASALLVSVGLWRGYQFELIEQDVSMPGLANDVKVMHIADVHLGHHRGAEYLDRIVDEVNASRPDLVLFNGDLVETNHAVNQEALAPLQRLEAPAYFVNGNHELHVDHARLLELIEVNGVRVLVNEVVDTHGLQLVGLDYMRADENTVDVHAAGGPTIQAELPKLELDASRPTLLMHHSPVGVEYVADRGIELMVAGHTHAGQVFPMSWIAKLSFPYLWGLYETQDTRVFVSQGVGTFGVPMRMGTSNEIELLHLRAAPARSTSAVVAK